MVVPDRCAHAHPGVGSVNLYGVDVVSLDGVVEEAGKLFDIFIRYFIHHHRHRGDFLALSEKDHAGEQHSVYICFQSTALRIVPGVARAVVSASYRARYFRNLAVLMGSVDRRTVLARGEKMTVRIKSVCSPVLSWEEFRESAGSLIPNNL